MRICILTFEYPPLKGGIGLACRRIAESLAADHEVHVITTNPGKPNIFYNNEETVRIEETGTLTVHRLGPSSGLLVNVPPHELQNMFDYISRLPYEFDVFHGFRLQPAGYLAALLGKQFSKRSVVSIRGDDIAKDMFSSVFFPIIKWTLENADVVTSVAAELLERAALIADMKRPVTILNSLNPKEFYYKEGIHTAHDEIIIGTVGEIRRKKGFTYLLKAFSWLNKEYDVKLMIVGFFRPEEEKTYHDMIREFQLEDRIIVTGRVEKSLILNHIKNLDIAVFPAISEGCPNALLETMYCARPIIATRVGAMPQILDSKNGILIEPKSPEEIYHKVKELLDNPTLRNRLATKAKHTIKTNHIPESEKKEWLKVYNG
ncbi:MAG: glycosyltransferase [Nanobdellota archaeon]